MFCKFLPVVLFVLLLSRSTCSAERGRPLRSDSLSKRSPSPPSQQIPSVEFKARTSDENSSPYPRSAKREGGSFSEFDLPPYDLSLKKRQSEVSAQKVIADYDPVPQVKNPNNSKDSAFLEGAASGSKGPVENRSAASDKPLALLQEPYPLPHPIPEPYQLNEIKHLIATGGKIDESIEYS